MFAVVQQTAVRVKQEFREWLYLGGQVLLAGEGFSESTEAMLHQVIQITWEHKRISQFKYLHFSNQPVKRRCKELLEQYSRKTKGVGDDFKMLIILMKNLDTREH